MNIKTKRNFESVLQAVVDLVQQWLSTTTMSKNSVIVRSRRLDVSDSLHMCQNSKEVFSNISKRMHWPIRVRTDKKRPKSFLLPGPLVGLPPGGGTQNKGRSLTIKLSR